MGLYCSFDIIDDFGYTDATDEYNIVPNYREGNQVFVETFLRVSKELVPVDTGYLRSTLTARTHGESFCECYTDCEYAQYQEYGTWCMPAQPYFEIALIEALNEAAPYWDEAEAEAWLEEERLMEEEEEEQQEMIRASRGGFERGVSYSSFSAFVGSMLAMFAIAFVVVTIQAIFGKEFSAPREGGGRGSRVSDGAFGGIYIPDIEIT